MGHPSSDRWVNRQGFSWEISQVEMLENWKESPKEDFLDFFKCTVSCGALLGSTAGNSEGEFVGQFAEVSDGVLGTQPFGTGNLELGEIGGTSPGP